MAVAYMMRFPGATLEQYDQLIAKMGFTPGGAGEEDGGVFHWVAKTDDGLLIVDVWESDAHFERFAKGQIAPLSQEIGIPEPEITRHEVHNTLAAPRFLASVLRTRFEFYAPRGRSRRRAARREDAATRTVTQKYDGAPR